MKTLIAALTLGALAATPAFAHVDASHARTGKIASSKANHAHARKAGHHAFRVAPRRSTSSYEAYGAVTPFGSPTDRQNVQSTMSHERETALHDCSTVSRKYLDTTWGNMELHQYRTCMMQHGQPE
jgi:hypothetical protein